MKKYERIRSILIDEQSQSAFVTTDEDNINQINLRSGKTIKRYSNLGIGSIFYFSSFENLLCVGADNRCFTLINIFKRRLLTIQPVNTRIRRIRRINCSQFTILNRNNHPIVVLILSGGNSFLLFLYLNNHFMATNESLKKLNFSRFKYYMNYYKLY